MNLKTKLDAIEQQTRERGLSEAVLIATGERWQNLTEAERDQMQEAAQQIGTPIVIIDR